MDEQIKQLTEYALVECPCDTREFEGAPNKTFYVPVPAEVSHMFTEGREVKEEAGYVCCPECKNWTSLYDTAVGGALEPPSDLPEGTWQLKAPANTNTPKRLEPEKDPDVQMAQTGEKLVEFLKEHGINATTNGRDLKVTEESMIKLSNLLFNLKGYYTQMRKHLNHIAFHKRCSQDAPRVLKYDDRACLEMDVPKTQMCARCYAKKVMQELELI